MDHGIKTIGEALSRYRDSQRIAVICEGRAIRYDELWRCGCRIAGNLISMGLEKGERVVLDMGRSEHYICMLLGIALSGGISVYIHRGWPGKQREYVLTDCTPKFIVDEQYAKELQDPAFVHVSGRAEVEKNCTLPDVKGEDPFQIVYTSGSTGRPKGAVLCHLVAANISLPCERNSLCIFEKDSPDRLLLDADFSFVSSTILIMRALFNEKALVIATQRELSSNRLFAGLILEEHVTETVWTPTRTLKYLADQDMKAAVAGIRKLSVAGERIPESLLPVIRESMPDAKVFCAYGMSELMHVEDHPFKSGAETLFGSGSDNIGLHVLSDDGNPVKEGKSGEICVSGPPAVLGSYWNDPELTQSRYTQHPVFGRIFHTGDLAAAEQNGQLRFLGRRDQMAKLRGLRIDLQAIEQSILSYPDAREAVVMILEEGDRQTLAACYTRKIQNESVTDEERSASQGRYEAGLRRYLADSLPYYMVPALLLELPELPLNYNGKADRLAISKLLPQKTHCKASETETEKLLGRLYAEVLGLPEEAGADDSFFVLGGDSMSGMELSSRLADNGIHMEMKWLFAAPTPALLAPFLQDENAGSKEERTQETDKLPELLKWSEAQKQAIAGSGFTEEEIECLYPVTEGVERRLLDKDPWMLADYWLIPYDSSTVKSITGRLEEMTKAHQALRSVFLFPAGERPVQAVLKKGMPEFFYEDLSDENLPGEDLSDEDLSLGERKLPEKMHSVPEEKLSSKQKQFFGRRLRYDFAQKVDLERGPLWRIGLVRIKKDRAVLYRFYSHTLLDGQSMLRFKSELLSDSEICPDQFQMRMHYRKLLLTSHHNAQAYWNSKGIPRKLISLTAPAGKLQTESVPGTKSSMTVDGYGLKEQVRAYCSLHNVTQAALLHYCLGRALCSIFHQKECCFFSLSGGRRGEETGLIGNFTYSFPFLFHEEYMVRDCQEQLLEAEKHAWVWALPGSNAEGACGLSLSPGDLQQENRSVVVLDVINVYEKKDDDSASLLSVYDALDEIGLKVLFQNIHKNGRETGRFLIVSSAALGQMYSGTYDSARIDQKFVGLLSEELSFVLREVTGPNGGMDS